MDWERYIQDHVNDEIWGLVLLDSYAKKNASNPAAFLEAFIEDLETGDIADLVEFHRVLLEVAVQLLRDDFDAAVGISACFVTACGDTAVPVLGELRKHYAQYGKQALFDKRVTDQPHEPDLDSKAQGSDVVAHPGTVISTARDLYGTAELRILVLSDVHFGALHYRPDDDVQGPPEAMVRSLRQLRRDGLPGPDLVVVTGDLTSTASSEEYDEAYRFLLELRTVVRELDSEAQVVVLPGNHDVAWTDVSPYTDRLERFETSIRSVEGMVTPFSPTTSSADGSVVTTRALDGTPVLLVRLPSKRITLLGLTTVFFSGEPPEDLRELAEKLMRAVDGDRSLQEDLLKELIRRDRGTVSAEALDAVERILPEPTDIDFAESIRIAFSHHPMATVAATPGPRNGASIRTSLRDFGFPVIVSGHTHYVDRRPDTAHATHATQVSVPSLAALGGLDHRGALLVCVPPARQSANLLYWDYDSEGRFTMSPEYLRVVRKLDLS